MYTRFRFKLFLTMIIFAVVICITIAFVDYSRLKEQTIQHNDFQLKQIEDSVTYTLKTLDKAYYFFDDETAADMKEKSLFLIDKYETNTNLDEWDFNELRKTLGMDIYMIDENNRITHSTFENDIGLDFDECCAKLADVLDQRRSTGEFYHDGMDLEQQTGEIKKYSYMATRDKRYLIELGLSLTDGMIFNEFNFLAVNEELISNYPSVNDINILNIGGYTLGTPKEEMKLSKERRSAFEETLQTGKVAEVRSDWQGESAIYHYIRYTSAFDQGTTKHKVIEIVYNEDELFALLDQYRQSFYIELIIILLVAIIIATLISRWVSKPIHMAFHDSLTELKNRTAFNEILQKPIESNEKPTAVMMIDIDNFKQINDYFGHDEGDILLRTIASSLQQIIGNKGTVYRYGGDEFIAIIPFITKEEAEEIATQLVTDFKHSIKVNSKWSTLDVSLSLGISFSSEHGDNYKQLCKKADIALYVSKEKGKNQYQIYSDDITKYHMINS